MGIALFFVFIYFNRNTKKFLVDDIASDQRWILFQKTIQGAITNFIFYYAVSKVSLTEVSLINNTTPIFVAALSYILLHEGLKGREIVALLMSFGGILLLIYGKEENGSGAKKSQTFALILLVIGVSLAGMGFIYVRKLRFSHFLLTPTYMNILSLMIFIPICYAE